MLNVLAMAGITAFAGRILAACDSGNGGGTDGGTSGTEAGALADGASSADGVGLPSDATDTDLPSDVTDTDIDDGSDLPNDVTPANDVTDTDGDDTLDTAASDVPGETTPTIADTNTTDAGQTVADTTGTADVGGTVADTGTDTQPTTQDAENAYDDTNNLKCNTVGWCKTPKGDIGVLAGCDVNNDGKIDPGETTCIKVCDNLGLPCTKPDGTSGKLQTCDFDNNGSYGEPGKNELICD